MTLLSKFQEVSIFQEIKHHHSSSSTKHYAWYLILFQILQQLVPTFGSDCLNQGVNGIGYNSQVQAGFPGQKVNLMEEVLIVEVGGEHLGLSMMTTVITITCTYVKQM